MLTIGKGANAVMLSAWDLGGAHVYDAVNHMHFMPGALNMLVVPAHRAGPSDDDDGEEVVGRHLDVLQACAPGAVVQIVLTQVDRLLADFTRKKRQELEKARNDHEMARVYNGSGVDCKPLESEIAALEQFTPSALAAAAAPQLGWLRSKVEERQRRYNERRRAALEAAIKHEQRRAKGGSDSHGNAASPSPPAVPQALRVHLDHIPCVCSVKGGGASLEALRERLESLVLCEPPLLPCVGRVLPRSGQAAMTVVRALRDGRDPAVDDPAADPSRRLSYCTLRELDKAWRSMKSSAVLSDVEAADVLGDALQLMCEQGELLVASGIAFLDPLFAAQVLKPLVEHSLSKKRAQPEVVAFVKARREGNVQRLLEAVEALAQHGEVREALLPFLWRSPELASLRKEDYGSVVQMLIAGGLLFERHTQMSSKAASAAAAATEGGRVWFMPMRLPDEKHPEFAERLWPERSPDGELRMQYELYDGVVPPGMPESLVAKCQAIGGAKAIKTWRRGVLVSLQGVRVLLEVVTGDPVRGDSGWVRIAARGKALDDALWQVMEKFVERVAAVLADFAGLQYGKELVCPGCIWRGDGQLTAWDPDHLEVNGAFSEFCELCNETVLLRPSKPVPPKQEDAGEVVGYAKMFCLCGELSGPWHAPCGYCGTNVTLEEHTKRVAELVAKLNDSNAGVRMAVVEELSQLGDRRTHLFAHMDKLVDRLNAESDEDVGKSLWYLLDALNDGRWAGRR